MKRYIMMVLVHCIVLSGCATREYVDSQIAPIREKQRKHEVSCCEAPVETPFLDINRDQRVSREEFDQFVVALFELVKRKLDLNGDGTVSSEEFFHRRSTLRYIFLAKSMDTDADGWITSTEFKAYHHQGFQKILAAFDADGDNRISEEDFVSHNQKKFAVVDQNDDGSLDLTEINAVLQKLAGQTEDKGATYWQYCYKPHNPEFCLSHPKYAPPLVLGPGNSWGGVWPSNPDPDNGDAPPHECPVDDLFEECHEPWDRATTGKSRSSLDFFYE